MRRCLVAPLLVLGMVAGCGGGDGGDGMLSRDDAAPSRDTVEGDDDDAGSRDGGATTKSAAAVVRKVAARATEEGSARFSAEVSAGTVSTFAFEGEVDLDRGNAAFEFDLGNLGIPGATAEAVEFRLVDQVLYFDVSALAAADPSASGGLPPGVRWVSLDLTEFSESFGTTTGVAGSTDPSSLLDSLRGVSDEVREVGREEVRGVETTRYAAELDPAKALEQVPPEQRNDAEEVLDALGDEPIPIEVWIDDDGLLRRLTMEVPVPAGDAAGARPVTVTLELFDYGLDVEVEAPPPDEVADFGELLGGLGPAAAVSRL